MLIDPGITSYSKKVTEDVRKYAAEQGISENEALEKGLKEKPLEWSRRESSDIGGQAERPSERERMSQFVEKGVEVYAKGLAGVVGSLPIV